MSLEVLLAELTRLWILRGIEDRFERAGYPLVAGVDEAGRGALAGPVVVAAVVMASGRTVLAVDDSKALSPEVRSRLADRIRESALGVSVATASAEEIDRSDVLTATRRAMKEALSGLRPPPSVALVDAVPLPDAPCPAVPLVRADTSSYVVACASIVAKVERDRAMGELDRRFPHYGFAGHKGYGAESHREALATFGPSPIHRLTFGSVIPRRRARS